MRRLFPLLLLLLLCGSERVCKAQSGGPGAIPTVPAQDLGGVDVSLSTPSQLVAMQEGVVQVLLVDGEGYAVPSSELSYYHAPHEVGKLHVLFIGEVSACRRQTKPY